MHCHNSDNNDDHINRLINIKAMDAMSRRLYSRAGGINILEQSPQLSKLCPIIFNDPYSSENPTGSKRSSSFEQYLYIYLSTQTWNNVSALTFGCLYYYHHRYLTCYRQYYIHPVDHQVSCWTYYSNHEWLSNIQFQNFLTAHNISWQCGCNYIHTPSF